MKVNLNSERVKKYRHEVHVRLLNHPDLYGNLHRIEKFFYEHNLTQHVDYDVLFFQKDPPDPKYSIVTFYILDDDIATEFYLINAGDIDEL